MTGLDLVSASLRLIGAIAPGETPSASEITDGLSAINRMIDSWSTESLIIYADTREEFTLTVGQQEYTMGPSGDFNTSRPLRFLQGTIKVETNTPAVEYQLLFASLEEWVMIKQKGLTSNIPSYIYTENSYPLATVSLYPVPSVANKLVLYTQKQLTSIASQATVLSLPPGYEEALVYNAAVRLAPEYGKAPTEIVFAIANESKANIKRLNIKPAYLRVDDALIEPARFNIYTGDYR
jgi:hypothetical protein